jgi:hypothetical protein
MRVRTSAEFKACINAYKGQSLFEGEHELEYKHGQHDVEKFHDELMRDMIMDGSDCFSFYEFDFDSMNDFKDHTDS